MRPVERGGWPTDGSGNPIQFKEYSEARPELLDRLGSYCSYCEMKIENGPAVEHVLPKKKNPALERDWHNFLLSCDYCNSGKQDKDVSLHDYFWPDRDNTFRAFFYADGIVSVAPGLASPADQARASRTISLTGLDRMPGGPKEPTGRDQRWIQRRIAWGKATRARSNLSRRDTPELREQIVETATSTGFFSIWMAVFADDTDMKQRFIQAFPGTCTCCFDPEGNPLPRPAGTL
jgi:uncharacterized protein (TIGR02646 family)